MSEIGFFTALTLICVGVQVYHYLLYPLLLGVLRNIFRPSETGASTSNGRVSLIICAYNEQGIIEQKLRNSVQLSPAPFEILVVCDGSDDSTGQTAKNFSEAEIPIEVLYQRERQGKSAAMNRGVERAKGDILLFSDANAMYRKDAISAILQEFADKSVAVVSGAKRIVEKFETENASSVGVADGIYWRYEAFIRQCESDIGSTVASVGEIVAIRRGDWRPIPKGTVNDDAWMTMSNLALGKNVRFAPQAVCYEKASETHKLEAIRRRRMNAGRLKLITQKGVWPWRRPWVLIAFFSHKVLRLFLPIPMIVGFLANIVAITSPGSLIIMDWLLGLHLAVLFLFGIGYIASVLGKHTRIPLLAYHVIKGNISALFAIWDAIQGKSHAIWEKPPR